MAQSATMPIRSVQRARRSGLQFDAASGAGYVLQMWQIRPEDWPLLLWEMDGYSLEEAKARAERWRPARSDHPGGIKRVMNRVVRRSD